MPTQPQGSVGSDSSSDEDYYDNFDKFKKKQIAKRTKPKVQPTVALAQPPEVEPNVEPRVETNDADLTIDLASDSIRVEPVSRRCMIQLRAGKSGKSMVVRWDMDEPFRKLVDVYAPKLDLSASKAVLIGEDRRYQLDKTPEAEGLSEESITAIDLLEDAEGALLPLKVLMKGKRPFSVKIPPDQRFSALKASLCKEYGLEPTKVRLIFDNEALDEDSTPEMMEMEEEDCIDLFIDK